MVNSHPCVAESITVQSITSKPSDFNNLLWPEVLWIGWSVLTPPAVVGWSLDSARALERAEMVGPHSPSGPSLQLLLGMADWRCVMRRRNRCGRPLMSESQKLASCQCFLLVKASHKPDHIQSIKGTFSRGMYARKGRIHDHIFLSRPTKLYFKTAEVEQTTKLPKS